MDWSIMTCMTEDSIVKGFLIWLEFIKASLSSYAAINALHSIQKLRHEDLWAIVGRMGKGQGRS